jgi:uncharacterized protein (TIGR02145 family)
MFKIFTLIIIGTLLSVTSCKKNNDGPKSVVIEGTEYPTVTIGAKIWTSVNYAGPGGISIPANDPIAGYADKFGKYYSAEAAYAIKLPEGWRLPTKIDLEYLLSYYPSKTTLEIQNNTQAFVALASSTDWEGLNGMNISGFNMYPAGTVSMVKNTNGVVEYSRARREAAVFSQDYKGSYVPGQTLENYYLYLSSEGKCYISSIPNANRAAPAFSVRFVRDK